MFRYRANDYGNVDLVIHLAAQTSVFNKSTSAILRDNIEAFKKIVDFTNEVEAKLVYASSSCAANITSMCGISKQFNEQYAKIYARKSTGIRFHNVYSRTPRKGTLLYNLLNEEKPKIYNHGKNMRHFTHISDVIDGIIYAIASSEKLINVCNPEKNSVAEFCDELGKYVDMSKLVYVGDRIEFDKVDQNVEKDVFTVNLDYKSIREGLEVDLKITIYDK